MSRVRIMAIDLLAKFILPFFEQYPLMGFKQLQYNIWVKAVKLIIKSPSYSVEREVQLTAIITELKALVKSKDRKS